MSILNVNITDLKKNIFMLCVLSKWYNQFINKLEKSETE